MLNLTNIDSLIQQLSTERLIFHSEADFQHALAWRIHETYPGCSVRLEVNPYKDGRRDYLDILLYLDSTPIAIELKYKTRKLDLSWNDEDYHLQNQSAQDIGRYDFIKDISRLERFVSANPQALGFAVFLSNDSTYWRPTKRQETVDHQFRIHENQTLKGTLQWGELASAGTRRGREKELVLVNEYPLIWHQYSTVDESLAGEFKYLLLAIGKQEQLVT